MCLLLATKVYALRTRMYGETMPARNLHLIMGTMAAHPRTFIVIGLLRSGIDPAELAKQGNCFSRGSPSAGNRFVNGTFWPNSRGLLAHFGERALSTPRGQRSPSALWKCECANPRIAPNDLGTQIWMKCS